MKALLTLVAVVTLAPIIVAQESPRTILAVFAHSDDEIIVGPLLARYARQGAKIHLVIVTKETSGRPGVAHGIPDGPELARARADEARCSCRELGIEPPTLLNFEDGRLGQVARPPWGYLARVESEIRKLLVALRPDIVITFGPEGMYGHPDHRLVGAVVTQLVQSGAEGAPVQLLYPGFPKDRLSKWRGEEPLSPVGPFYLTIRVAYSKDDFSAFRKSFSCYKTQFEVEEINSYPKQLDDLWGGHIYLRPWFGSENTDDIFKLKRR